ncbi:electron transport complex subunit RsxG [Agaribacterium haliotis]|uniref:electron transport complex subunit RsxG n=1 Tax=Agaribacterium haliotis TaxID=2013869 RepID=UPI000BB5558E|nr:electron transport complex subunit RsxG [Agaribacterium haliotis]
MLGQSIARNSLILAVFAFVTAGTLAWIHKSTETRIAEQEKRAAEKALLEILSADQFDNDLLATTWTLTHKQQQELNLHKAEKVHIASKAGRAVALIIPAIAPDGYSGDIKLLVGVKMDGSLSGVRVLAHKETPGLGDKVETKKSDWILKFKNLSLIKPKAELWSVKKDGGYFDQFTGATITPRAVVKQSKAVLEFFAKHKEQILASQNLEATE